MEYEDIEKSSRTTDRVNNETNSLNDLFVNKSDVINLNLLVKTLKPYVQLSNEGEVFPLPDFEKLTQIKKILIILLAKKAIGLKLGVNYREFTKPKELHQKTGIPQGTINPTLRYLLNKRLVVSNKSGEYFIPNYAFMNVHKIFENLSKHP